MDKDELTKKLKELKKKAKAARSSGKREIALQFRAGARRLRRKIKGLEPRGTKKKSEE